MSSIAPILGQRPELGAEFDTITSGNRVLYLHHDLADRAEALLARLDTLGTNARAGAGNRGSAFRLTLDGMPPMFARRSHRGGLVRLLADTLYLGRNPRPLCELAVTVQARRRGIAVAEPMGAMIEWLAPIAYRGVFLTRALDGMTLWEFARTDDDPAVKMHVVTQARRAIDKMHAEGLVHADLNLHNVLVATSEEQFNVVILDLDKARLLPGPVPPPMRRKNRNRLLRSVRKLDPAGRYFDAAILQILSAG